jgi:hypothetical protein
MRADAAKLLTRLGRNDFRYREFTDAFADAELWPIFEALLTDERMMGKPQSLLAAKEEGAPSAGAPADPQTAEPETPRPMGNLIASYARPEPEKREPKPDPAKGDLRDFLSKLSQQPRGENR